MSFIYCSGGKDSCYNMMQCVAMGHSIVALANLTPINEGNSKIALLGYHCIMKVKESSSYYCSDICHCR